MANATITAPAATQTTNFGVTVVFDTSVTGFDQTDVDLRTLTGNGATNIIFSISGTEPTDTFTLMFVLPAAAEGSFEISITGMVTPEGGSTPEGIMANTAVVSYDTTTSQGATFGTAVYPGEEGIIAIPVTFAEAILSPDESIINLSHISGDELDGTEMRLAGEDANYEIIVQPPLDREGSFSVGISGRVFIIATEMWDSVTVAPLTVPYNNIIPDVKDNYIPEYEPQERLDAKFAFIIPVQGIHANNAQDVIKTSQPIGTGTPYKWTGTEPTNQMEIQDLLEAEEPDDLSTTDWEVLQPRPMNHMGPWYGEELQYLLMRYDPVPADLEGIVNFVFDGAPEGVRNKGY